MGCPLPLVLAYDVPNHVWYEALPDETIRVGITRVAVALASDRIFAFTPKRVGRALEKGKSCATIESSKWVGPARIAFDGTVVAINERLVERPHELVQDPYGAGWMLIARPTTSDPLAGLVTGEAAVAAYAAWMRDNDFPGCVPAA
jgi:glycine cleavage system H protein